ncbi:MAG TPA: hypothetical protein PKN27_04445 [Propionibacteriaceae bacterium]|nr:hypothetical protein [Propionibacteriaceae bacterium]
MRIPKFMIVAAAACLGLGMITGAATAAPAPRPVPGSPIVSYVSFDVGGAIPGGGVDTNVTGMTATATTPGLVVGTYRMLDAVGSPTSTRVGFVAHTRKNFAIRSIETVRPFDSTDVNITSVNSSGTTSGYYLDDALVEHGFLRAANGENDLARRPGREGSTAVVVDVRGRPLLA